jgi:hypothetical protein
MTVALDLFSRPPGLVRRAKYAPEFLEAMRGRKFRNPESGNEVVFDTLSDEEQKRIHDYWMRARQRQQEPAPKPQRQIPEEALKATTLTPNKDPHRYQGVEVEYGSLGEDSDEIKKELHDILGEAAKKAGVTPEQLALDLAGGGGVPGLKAVKLMTLQSGNRSAIMVSAEGDDVVEMDRELFFLNGRLSSIRNKHLELAEDAPKGMGTRMLATQVASMKDTEPDSFIKTTGAGCFDCDYSGYYVWPLLGFDGQIPEDDVSQMPPDLIEELEDTGGGPPFRISELMSFPEGRKYWLELGAEIELEFPVKNDDVLQKYVQRKAEGAGKTVGQFLHNASEKTRSKTKGSDKVERAPELDKADLQILSKIWDSLPKKRSKKDKTMTTKNATRALIDLAKEDPSFRKALLSEVVKEGNININIRDFAMDEFSQHQMLRNLRAGDLIEILYEPNELHPQLIATRLVDSDFDPELPGVLLQGTSAEQEMLVDRGQGMPLVWEPGSGPAFPVLKLKIVHSKLAAEAEEKSDKATAAQIQFALDLSEEKGKSHTKSELAKKTKAEISSLIEKMQGEETVASAKQVSYAHSLLEQAGRKSPSKSSLEKMSETEVSKLIDELKGANKKANEILAALGGRRKLESLLGARGIKLYKNELLFSWPNRMASKGTSCGISMLDDGQCDVMFMTPNESGALQVVAQYKVPTNELAQTFEKQTGWFLRL